MNIEYTEKLNRDIKVRVHKCTICPICADHCDFGCPKANIDTEIVTMKLVEISIIFNEIIYKCKYKNNIYNILKEQII